jgi:hypothetical protein
MDKQLIFIIFFERKKNSNSIISLKERDYLEIEKIF